MVEENKQQEKEMKLCQMNKGIVIENPIYPQSVIVFRGEDSKKMFSFFKKSLGKDEWKKHKNRIQQVFNSNYAGMTLSIIDSHCLIHLTEEAGSGCIAHEAFHATEFIFKDLDIKFGKVPNEPYAYFLGFLVKEIVNNLYK